jgi:hypothetical protein
MIKVTAETPWAELAEQIRHVPLLQPRDGVTIFPYLDAEITLREVAYDEVRPTSLYVLSGNLAIQKQLVEALAPEHDPLNLKGGLTLVTEDNETIGLIPPIVEETAAQGQYILDGMHRATVGRMAGRTTFVAIHISGFRDDCPAAVLPNDWAEVIEYDETPSDPSLKRRYRDNPLSLRRDYSALNGSRPRA